MGISLGDLKLTTNLKGKIMLGDKLVWPIEVVFEEDDCIYILSANPSINPNLSYPGTYNLYRIGKESMMVIAMKENIFSESDPTWQEAHFMSYSNNFIYIAERISGVLYKIDSKSLEIVKFLKSDFSPYELGLSWGPR